MIGVRASNLHASLSRVMRWMEGGGKGRLPDSVWEAWNWAKSELEGPTGSPEFSELSDQSE